MKCFTFIHMKNNEGYFHETCKNTSHFSVLVMNNFE